MFFPDFAPVYLLVVLQTLSLLFLWKNFCEIKRNNSRSWKSLFPLEENYFNRILTSLISLWWVMYEGSFQVCDARWWKKILVCQTLKLGHAPVHPQLIFKENQASKLGDVPRASPSPSKIISSSLVPLYFYHFMRNMLCLEHLVLYFS